MYIVNLDLEGVLFPEIWIGVAEKTGIEALRLTTRDVADYDELMRHRLKIFEEKNLTLTDVQGVINTLEPLPGAVEFLDWLRDHCQVMILSDTFVEFAKPVMKQLKMPTILCHSLKIDKNNAIVTHVIRIQDAKRKAIEAFRNLNYQTIAVGDSFNDVGMLETAHHGIFFCPPEEITQQYPAFPVTRNYQELKSAISNIIDENN